jgi:hypothetical protein
MKLTELTPEHLGRRIKVTNPDPRRFPPIDGLLTGLNLRYSEVRNETRVSEALVNGHHALFITDDIELVEEV